MSGWAAVNAADVVVIAAVAALVIFAIAHMRKNRREGKSSCGCGGGCGGGCAGCAMSGKCHSEKKAK